MIGQCFTNESFAPGLMAAFRYYALKHHKNIYYAECKGYELLFNLDFINLLLLAFEYHNGVRLYRNMAFEREVQISQLEINI